MTLAMALATKLINVYVFVRITLVIFISITILGGLYVDKLTSRDLTKTKRLVCLTDITKQSKTHCSIKVSQFLFSRYT